MEPPRGEAPGVLVVEQRLHRYALVVAQSDGGELQGQAVRPACAEDDLVVVAHGHRGVLEGKGVDLHARHRQLLVAASSPPSVAEGARVPLVVAHGTYQEGWVVAH